MLSLAAGALLLFNGDIRTLDPERPRAEALLAIDGTIAFVGSEREARARASAAAAAAAGASAGAATLREIDLRGRQALPAFIDAHAHLGALGALELGTLDLREARSWHEVVAAVRAEAARRRPGEWILGGRWDHESWPGRALPTHDAISEAAPENPVWLERVDGHMGIANRAALAAAGIGRDTRAPPGGEIVRDARGEPTGVLVDNAIDLVAAKIPASARPRYEDLVLAAQERCLRAGLAGVHDAGVAPEEAAALARLAESGRLKIHVHAMISGSDAGLAHVERTAPLVRAGPGGQLSVRAVKLFADGALGSRGAWLLAPYADRPRGEDGAPWVGLPVMAPDRLRRAIDLALRRGWQVAVHAIGDRANREVLDALADAARARGRADLAAERPRVEHAQVVDPEDFPRFAALGAIASMQPTHATSDMRWAERRLGRERLRGAYAWASLLRAGARLALGSDFPVEAPDPLLGIHAAVARQDARGEPAGGWLPHERLTREEAVRGFTQWAAYAGFEEDRRGVLAPGKRADVVVVSRDLFFCAPEEIAAAEVEMTIVGGEVLHERARR